MTTDEGLKLTSFVHRLNGWCMLNCFPPPSILVCWLVKEADLPASCIFFFWCPMLVLHPYCQTPSVNKPKWVWIKNTPFLLNVVDLCTLSLKVQHDLWVPTWTLWVGGLVAGPIHQSRPRFSSLLRSWEWDSTTNFCTWRTFNILANVQNHMQKFMQRCISSGRLRVRERVRKSVSVTKLNRNITFTHFLVREHLCLSHIFICSAACLMKKTTTPIIQLYLHLLFHFDLLKRKRAAFDERQFKQY